MLFLPHLLSFCCQETAGILTWPFSFNASGRATNRQRTKSFYTAPQRARCTLGNPHSLTAFIFQVLKELVKFKGTATTFHVEKISGRFGDDRSSLCLRFLGIWNYHTSPYYPLKAHKNFSCFLHICFDGCESSLLGPAKDKKKIECPFAPWKLGHLTAFRPQVSPGMKKGMTLQVIHLFLRVKMGALSSWGFPHPKWKETSRV